eukprot:1574571-Amphidinium_carterae.1
MAEVRECFAGLVPKLIAAALFGPRAKLRIPGRGRRVFLIQASTTAPEVRQETEAEFQGLSPDADCDEVARNTNMMS